MNLDVVIRKEVFVNVRKVFLNGLLVFKKFLFYRKIFVYVV